MLHHQHRVAQAFEPLQRAEQAFVVALVQADAGLVQHVEHAGEARADLAREPDALAFAAGERGRAARQGEVIEPDIDQELQPLVDLAQNPPGDFQPLRRQRVGHAGEPVARAAIDISATSARFLPATFTASASGFSRAPWQTAQGRSAW